MHLTSQNVQANAARFLKVPTILECYALIVQRLRVAEYALLWILGLTSEHERRLLEGSEKFGFLVRNVVDLSEFRSKYAE